MFYHSNRKPTETETNGDIHKNRAKTPGFHTAFRYDEGRREESMLLAKVISKCLLYSDPTDTNVPLTNGHSLA